MNWQTTMSVVVLVPVGCQHVTCLQGPSLAKDVKQGLLSCSARTGWDDDDEVVAQEAAVVDPYGRLVGVPLAAPVVEGIFGWRWPSTDKRDRCSKPCAFAISMLSL